MNDRSLAVTFDLGRPVERSMRTLPFYANASEFHPCCAEFLSNATAGERTFENVEFGLADFLRVLGNSSRANSPNPRNKKKSKKDKSEKKNGKKSSSKRDRDSTRTSSILRNSTRPAVVYKEREVIVEAMITLTTANKHAEFHSAFKGLYENFLIVDNQVEIPHGNTARGTSRSSRSRRFQRTSLASPPMWKSLKGAQRSMSRSRGRRQNNVNVTKEKVARRRSDAIRPLKATSSSTFLCFSNSGSTPWKSVDVITSRARA